MWRAVGLEDVVGWRWGFGLVRRGGRMRYLLFRRRR